MLGRTSVRSLATLALIALLAIAVGLWSQNTASADCPADEPDCAEVPTNAEVVPGGGATPVVDAKWELPDMQPKLYGFQYWAGSGPTDLNDNDIPDADDDPLASGMQMAPNLCDEAPVGTPSEREIEYWAIAEDENGLDDIVAMYSDVWQPGTDAGQALCPNGEEPVGGYCFKYQVDLTTLDCSVIGTWDDTVPDSVVTLADPILAAIDTNQISRTDAEELVKRCTKGEVKVAKGTQTLAQHEPAGEYRVVASALDHQSNEGTLTNYFTALPIIGLRIDFSLVDWGSILPGITDIVSGDENMTTPAKPTVKDCGNVDMSITLEYSDMVKTGDTSKVINSFDAKLLGETLQFASEEEKTFSSCLIPCHPKQLDLSIHPPEKLPGGVYTGDLDITGGFCNAEP